ncbi:MAG: Eco57I restriction-modification methylase domain-containing protein [Candidatus Cloacimonetes bacterium]|nr:Eco57I restriction-modification methylase domain-containing protein [Candidatus Cloacimonadota bacterium]MCF7815102.1 Eco57I restriction-modification methylase domain-containing protein [Candidatus Cloacimonadota bacterium]MCF7868053.1 Eco57I restriction-modification methylase domain-containing protein [Candidatus Cloacimonadota bacterium]MCF7883973.1 Eco57I restriction-modification methylase domain-containing protein [Candidatus Cloacimonadota bacterium]
MLKSKYIKNNKACAGKFGRNEITQEQLDDFENKFRTFYERFKTSKENETEEYFKNLFRDFLLNSFYKNKHAINTKSFTGQHGTDLAIHASQDVNSRVEVLIEFKKPTNKTGMISIDNLNRKAMHEAVLYYLQERMKNNNVELKYIIITNLNEFFIFDAKHFHKLFYENATIRNVHASWSSHKTDDDSTRQMYDIIAQQISGMETEIETIHFELNDFVNFSNKSNKSKIKHIYQILSPRFLLKETVLQDSNELNKNFYNELLYIMGLEEYKEKNKKLIRRCENRQEGSLLENTINQMKTHYINHPEDYGGETEDQQFNYSLQLNITWINRILFLKLLEAQLISYHNKDQDYAFLNYKKIKSYKELSELFFQVLAIKQNERSEYIHSKYKNLPYLNSSLFDRSKQEEEVSITELSDLEIPIYKKTVLKNGKKRLSSKMKTLEYLLRFLDAYNFGSEIEPDEDRKSLINASVLGLIFEKINGYKEGSYYTPGYITMYMSRETLRRSVLDKLNTAFEKDFQEFDELINFCSNLYNSNDLKKANDCLNSITICDPAVGSGHFLVSVLNEMIAIKAELGILCDVNAKPRKDWEILVANDELNIHNAFGEPFEYKLNENGKPHKELQNIQKTIFHEKQTIIENCLFGADINPNSVNICRLRLWIELLKNAYYTEESKFVELQTLPNIDINIKCGNSLISRFDLKENLSTVLKRTNMTVGEYLRKVRDYKNATGKQEKKALQNAIDQIKSNFKKEMMHQTEVFRKFARLERKYQSFFEDQDLFEEDRKIKQKTEEFEKTEKAYNKAKAEWEVWENGEVYRNAFEWRFEFPEVLDETGKFTGFDIVIGNPPYIQYGENAILRNLYLNRFYSASYKVNSYYLFFEQGILISNKNGYLSFITPKSYLKNKYAKKLREFIINNVSLISVDDFYYRVFEDVHEDVLITQISLDKSDKKLKYSKIILISEFDNKTFSNFDLNRISENDYLFEFEISEETEKLINKIYDSSIMLTELCGAYFGIQTFDRKSFVFDEKINEFCKPVIDGENIQKYNMIKSTQYVEFKPENIKSGGNEYIYNSTRLVTRQIADIPPFAIAQSGLYTLNTIYNIFFRKHCDKTRIHEILGILNSKLIGFIWKTKFYDKKGTYPKVKKTPLLSLPIPKSEVSLISEIVIENIKRRFDGNVMNKVLLKIDLILYKLYQLSYEEVLIVDPDFQLSKEEFERYEVNQHE